MYLCGDCVALWFTSDYGVLLNLYECTLMVSVFVEVCLL